MYIIAGFGYVGNALHFTAASHFPHFIIDPKHFGTEWNDPVRSNRKVKGIIVCVPTPESSDGSCDYSAVEEVLGQVQRWYPKVPVLIKSTVSLEAWDILRKQFSQLNLTHSPEFIKAKTAKEDFARQPFVVVAGDDEMGWAGYFKVILPKAEVYRCSPKEAIMMKYASNCFVAVKVSFFNHIHDLCLLQGLDFERVRSLAAKRSDIGANHTKVTEARGWGGHCLPKDTAAMLHTSKLLDYDFGTLKAVVAYNWSIRKIPR